ncbi:transaldolase family protein [Nanoarchaeota archaeon]
MKIFVDSANIEEIRYAYSGGVVDGVTTNPSLIKKAVDILKEKGEKVDMEGYIKDILLTAKGTPVSLEVTETSYRGMVEQGKKIFEKFNPVADNVYIKIPVNPSMEPGDNKEYDGIKAIKDLSKEGIPVNCTLVFTPEQALLAARAGAKFVSPFAGRIDDFIRKSQGMEFDKSAYFPAEGMEKDNKTLNDNGMVSGVELVAEIVEIFEQHGIDTCEVLAASLRNTRQVRECALAGAHLATIPFSVIKKLLDHTKTMEGMKAFAKDTIPEYVEVIE